MRETKFFFLFTAHWMGQKHLELLDCRRQHQVHFPKFNYCFSCSFFLTGNKYFLRCIFVGDAIVSWSKGFLFLFAAFGVGSHALEELAALGGLDSTSFSFFLASSQRP